MPSSTSISGAEKRSCCGREDLQRRALESVLAWDGLDRSKNLRKLLTFICNRTFEGRTDDLKEYNIAVDALERQADFDQKRDAIVRVEMHRLRKRLGQYYAGPGARDPVRIVFPEKGYVPEFVFTETANPLTPVETAAVPVRTPIVQEYPAVRHSEIGSWKKHLSTIWIGVAVGIGVLLVVAGVAIAFRSRPAGMPPAAPQQSPATAAPQAAAAGGATNEVRILAGRTASGYTDRDGQVWEGDRYFQGGQAVATRSDIVTRGFDRNLFASMREGSFEYAIPLARGSYEVELFFAETLFGEGNPLGGGPPSHEFEIHVNGSLAVPDFDLLADAGMPNLADSKVLENVQPAADGFLHLGFLPAPGRKAQVNAIWVRPSRPGKMNPIRIAARPQALQDSAGQWWLSDRYYVGGIQAVRPTLPLGMEVPEVYQGERYGDFGYSIPVPPGRYTATLYFCEYWWGKGHPGGSGRRRFDVYCNFKPLLSGFDITSETTGSAQTLKKVFHGLTPNRKGKLVFSFVSIENYAMVNAIEIVGESADPAR